MANYPTTATVMLIISRYIHYPHMALPYLFPQNGSKLVQENKNVGFIPCVVGKTSSLYTQQNVYSDRGAGLAAICLQDLTRVGEGEGGVGFLGNSWLS